MKSQIFKDNVPNSILIQFLEKTAIKMNNCFIINNDSFKKGLYNDHIQSFYDEIKEYYHISKRKYLETKLTYNSFITIIRQICKFNKVTYTSQIKYDKSNYDIIYYIYV